MNTVVKTQPSTVSAIPRGRAVVIIVLALLPLAVIAIVIGSPQGWFLIFAFLMAPFSLVIRDRPPVFAGILSAIVAAGLWWAGTATVECTVSVEENRSGLLTTVRCPRPLLPDLDHAPTRVDAMIAYLGMWPVGLSVGGAAAAIVDRRMRRNHPLVPPPPPPPRGGET